MASVDNTAAGIAWMTLDKVFQRAKQHHGKHAKEAIVERFRSDTLKAQASVLKIYEAEDCFEFPNDGMPPHFTNEEWRDREEAAYHWAFSKTPVPEDGSVRVLPGEANQFVWTCIGIAEEKTYALVPFSGSIEIIMEPEAGRILIHKYLVHDGRRWPNTRYRSDTGYRRYEAQGVRCMQTMVDAAFPYSTEHPSRRPQARPLEYPPDEALAFLSQH